MVVERAMSVVSMDLRGIQEAVKQCKRGRRHQSWISNQVGIALEAVRLMHFDRGAVPMAGASVQS